jgi:hypothetical protein
MFFSTKIADFCTFAKHIIYIHVMYKLDKTKFKGMTVEEANITATTNSSQSLIDNFKLAMYLNSIAFNFDLNSPPKLNKSQFTAIARK